jgi:transcriptional antiterminator RfaH
MNVISKTVATIPTPIEDTLSWYVVHTNPKQEERARGNLQAWGVETLNPKLLVSKCNQFTGQLTRVVKPLFPGYIFARFRFNDLYHKIRFTRGVHSVVRFDNHPTPVDEEIIDLIRSRLGTDGLVKTLAELKAGDEVVINEGRFQKLHGVFEREMQDADADRVTILLSSVSFQAHVVVDRALVSRISQESRPQPHLAHIV